MRLVNKKTAFTLIELLVVIAIIAILVVVIVMALNAARARARDSQRKTNLNSVRTGLEIYTDENNHYPMYNNKGVKCYSASSACLSEFKSDMQLETWPEDPLNGKSFSSGGSAALDDNYNYGYGSDDSADGFVLACTLETGDNAKTLYAYQIGQYKNSTEVTPIH